MLRNLAWLYLCLEVFSTFGIIFINCSSNCKRLKTKFTALMNHALTFDHPAGPICVYWTVGSSRVTSRLSSLALPLLCGWPKRKLMLTFWESGLPRLVGRLPHRSLWLHQWLSYVEREDTPFIPPPPNLERHWPISSLLSLYSSIFAQSAMAHWDM